MFPNWALLLPLFGLFSYVRTQQCNPFICADDWETRTDQIDNKVYGYKVFINSTINYFEANRICRDQCAEVVSFHSQDEYDFVFSIAKDLLEQCQTNDSVCPSRDSIPSFDKILRSFWIGMHRVQMYTPMFANGPIDSNITCIYPDGSVCDYGSYNGTVGLHEDLGIPWSTGTPNGANIAVREVVEDCVQFLNYTNGMWNDIPCHYRQSGVICKRDCASYCRSQGSDRVITTTASGPVDGIPGSPGLPGADGADATTQASVPGGGGGQPGGGDGNPGSPGLPGADGADATTQASVPGGGGGQPGGGDGNPGSPGQPGADGANGTDATTQANVPGGGGDGGFGDLTTTTEEPTTFNPRTTRRAPLPPPAPRRRNSRRPRSTVEPTTIAQ